MCLYSSKIARNFSKPIYKSLPWFLEYSEGKLAPEDELRYNSAVKERTKRTKKALGSPSEATKPSLSTTVDKNVEEVGQSEQGKKKEKEQAPKKNPAQPTETLCKKTSKNGVSFLFPLNIIVKCINQ